jgi:hypothetical protein
MILSGGSVVLPDAVHESASVVVEHQVLFRLDLRTPECSEQILTTIPLASIPPVSPNDHTPGQGQLHNVASLKRQYREPRDGRPRRCRSRPADPALVSADPAGRPPRHPATEMRWHQ